MFHTQLGHGSNVGHVLEDFGGLLLEICGLVPGGSLSPGDPLGLPSHQPSHHILSHVAHGTGPKQSSDSQVWAN